MILLTGVTTGILIKQNYLTVPKTVPVLSIWYCVNVGSTLDAIFVLVRGDCKTNFLGFKPGKGIFYSHFYTSLIMMLASLFFSCSHCTLND